MRPHNIQLFDGIHHIILEILSVGYPIFSLCTPVLSSVHAIAFRQHTVIALHLCLVHTKHIICQSQRHSLAVHGGHRLGSI